MGLKELNERFPGGLHKSSFRDTDYPDKQVYWYTFAGAQCPVCGHRDWCCVNITGTKVICMRESKEGAPAVAGGHLFELDGKSKIKFDPTQVEDDDTVKYTDTETMDILNRLVLLANPLTKNHREALKKRGLTDQEIDLHGSRGFGSYYETPSEAKAAGAKAFEQAKIVADQNDEKRATVISRWAQVLSNVGLPTNAWEGVPGFYLETINQKADAHLQNKETKQTFTLKAGQYEFPKFTGSVDGMLVPYYDTNNEVIGFQTRVDHVMVTAKDIQYTGLGTAQVFFKAGTKHYEVNIKDKANPYGKVVAQGDVKDESQVHLKLSDDLNQEITFTPHFGGKYFWASSAKKHHGAKGKTPIQVAYQPAIAQLKPNDPKLQSYRQRAHKTVWLTEGGLKALVAAAKLNHDYQLDDPEFGHDFLAVAGVSSFRKFYPVLEELNVENVIVAFDMDFQKNQQVKNNLKELMNGLHQRGYHVQLALWQHVKGIDDALVNHEEIKLRDLFDAKEGQALAKGELKPSDLPTLKPKN